MPSTEPSYAPSATISLSLSAEALEKAAHILKNIAHPTRIAVVDLLRQCERMSVSELQEKLAIQDQALISHHLVTMRDRGILAAAKEGRNCYYSLADPMVLQILGCMQQCELPVKKK